MDNPSVQRTKTEPAQSSSNREERKMNLSSFRNFRIAKCIPFQRTLLFNINIIEKGTELMSSALVSDLCFC